MKDKTIVRRAEVKAITDIKSIEEDYPQDQVKLELGMALNWNLKQARFHSITTNHEEEALFAKTKINVYLNHFKEKGYSAEECLKLAIDENVRYHRASQETREFWETFFQDLKDYQSLVEA